MEIMPWRSRQMSPISSLQSELNRMFEDFFTQPFGLSLIQGQGQGQVGRSQQMVMPAIDVNEDENNITVTAELPGCDSKDVEISVQGDMLEIRGHKRDEQREEKNNYYRIERSYGEFFRRVALPTEVDSDQAEAQMENGVLTLRLPKRDPRSGRRTIQIQGGSSQRSQLGGQSSQQGQDSQQGSGSNQPSESGTSGTSQSSEFGRISGSSHTGTSSQQGSSSAASSSKSSRQSGR